MATLILKAQNKKHLAKTQILALKASNSLTCLWPYNLKKDLLIKIDITLDLGQKASLKPVSGE